MSTYKDKGWYFITKADGSERCVVKYYLNPDTDTWGFGFFVSDGGGFLPESDVSKSSVIRPVQIRAAE